MLLLLLLQVGDAAGAAIAEQQSGRAVASVDIAAKFRGAPARRWWVAGVAAVAGGADWWPLGATSPIWPMASDGHSADTWAWPCVTAAAAAGVADAAVVAAAASRQMLLLCRWLLL